MACGCPILGFLRMGSFFLPSNILSAIEKISNHPPTPLNSLHQNNRARLVSTRRISCNRKPRIYRTLHRNLRRPRLSRAKIHHRSIQHIPRIHRTNRARALRRTTHIHIPAPRARGHRQNSTCSSVNTLQRSSLHHRRFHPARLVHPHIIHHHIRRTGRRNIRRPRPVPAHRQIQQKIKRRIEHPSPIRRHIRRRANKIRLPPIVHINLNHKRRPDRPVNVTTRRRVIDSPSSRKRIHLRQAEVPAWRRARPMNRPLHFRRAQSVFRSSRRRNIFHDVELAARRPLRSRSHHPECRPQSRAHRQLHARFHPPVLKFSQSYAFHPRRSPRPGWSRLRAHSQRANNQMSLPILKRVRLFDVAHCRASGVLSRSANSGSAINFQLVIAPTVPANFMSPVARIRRRASHTGIEFIAPHRLTPILPVDPATSRGHRERDDQRRNRTSQRNSHRARQNNSLRPPCPNQKFVLHHDFSPHSRTPPLAVFFAPSRANSRPHHWPSFSHWYCPKSVLPTSSNLVITIISCSAI
jgi:hypothetical protein